MSDEKARLYELFAEVGKALTSPHRLQLLDLLAQAPRTVEDLAKEAGLSVANASQHLQRLKHARLVTAEKEGVHVRYSLADPSVARLWLALRETAEHQLAEVEVALDAYRKRRREFPVIGASELREGMESGDVVLLDVRPEIEFRAGHLPGARCIPWDQIEDRLDELPADATVAAYCRGPYCVYADTALGILRDRGWRVARLEEGVQEWARAGHPVVRPGPA